jgi:hypothetical protein
MHMRQDTYGSGESALSAFSDSMKSFEDGDASLKRNAPELLANIAEAQTAISALTGQVMILTSHQKAREYADQMSAALAGLSELVQRQLHN